MVRVQKQRLVNPAGKKRRRNLSAKQIKYFGSPAQKAALKRKRKQNAAAPSHRRRATSKPAVRRRARTPNPGEILTFGLAGFGNPAGRKPQRSNSMAKRKSSRPRRRNRPYANKAASRRRHINPAQMHRPRRRRHSRSSAPRRRYRNPGEISRVGNVFVKGAWVGAGAIGTRFLTQLALGSSNTGIFGYLANAVVALGLGYGTGKALGKEQGNLVTIGGFAALALRMFQELSPFGQALQSNLQGVGDVGVYGATTFFVPLAEAGTSDRGALALPGAVTPSPAPAPRQAQAGTAGVGRYSSGGGRYAR